MLYIPSLAVPPSVDLQLREHVRCPTIERPCQLQQQRRWRQSPKQGRRAWSPTVFSVVASSEGGIAQEQFPKVRIGGDVDMLPIGCGTLQWGDPKWGFGSTVQEADLQDTFEFLVDSGITFFDTAEVYGYQNIRNGRGAEQLLGQFLKHAPADRKLFVGTKFMPIPWTNVLVGGGFRLGKEQVLEALEASLRRLEMPSVDLYQIHFPFPTYSLDTLVAAFAEAVEKGLVKSVGVSNYSTQQMRDAHKAFARYGIPLVSNQVKYSLADLSPETSGLADAARELDVTLIAYSPLAQGLLSGKYAGSQAQATSKRFSAAQLEAYGPLVNLMRFLGAIHGNKTPTQVALNYLMSKGVVPILGCVSKTQAADLVEAASWRLSDDAVEALQEKARYVAKKS